MVMITDNSSCVYLWGFIATLHSEVKSWDHMLVSHTIFLCYYFLKPESFRITGLINFLKLIHSVNDRVKIWIRIFRTPKPILFPRNQLPLTDYWKLTQLLLWLENLNASPSKVHTQLPIYGPSLFGGLVFPCNCPNEIT